MYRKSNTIITALETSQEAKREPFSHVWKIHRKISENFYVLYRFHKGSVMYAPLYIHSFRFLTNRHLTKAQMYLYENPNPETLATVSDKLKWYRYQNGLLQSQVAKVIGVNRTTYSHYEENALESYPLDKLSKAAKLFGIEVTALLDEYNLFLYHGQGTQIKRLRKSMKLTQSQFAKCLDTPLGTLKSGSRIVSAFRKRLSKSFLSCQTLL